MCGIVGVVGNTNATDILIQGLEKLEYRGYDSAGVFLASEGKSQLVKDQILASRFPPFYPASQHPYESPDFVAYLKNVQRYKCQVLLRHIA